MMMAQDWAESTRETIDYGRSINQFWLDIIKSIWQLEGLNVYNVQSNMYVYIYIHTHTHTLYPFSILILFSYNMMSAKSGEIWKNPDLCLMGLVLEMIADSKYIFFCNV